MSSAHPDLPRLMELHRLAVSLRAGADPLLAGQYEGIIGRITALLAAVGAPVPDDALPPGES